MAYAFFLRCFEDSLDARDGIVLVDALFERAGWTSGRADALRGIGFACVV
jgi:hypothetical protein